MDSKIRNSYANNLKHTVSGKTLGQPVHPRLTHFTRHSKAMNIMKHPSEADPDRRRPSSLKIKKRSHNKKLTVECTSSKKLIKPPKLNNISLKSGKDHKPGQKKQQNLTTVGSEGKIASESLLKGRKSVRKFQPRNTEYVRQEPEDMKSEYRSYYHAQKPKKLSKEFRTTAKCRESGNHMDNSIELAKKQQIIKKIEKEPTKTKHSKDTAESILLDCLENIEPSSKNNDKHSTKDSKNQGIVKIAVKSSTKVGNLFDKQTQVNPKMRAILIDWLFRISSQMVMQRQTVHLAIAYLDDYTTKVHIPKDHYQLFGLAGLLIGYKQQFSHHEQFLQILATSCDNGYTQQQILEAQKKLAFALNFKLNPTTHNFWVEYFTLRWDRFLEKGQYAIQQETEALRLKTKPILFRCPTARSYNLYREILQLTDTALYCQTSVRMYDRPRLVIAGIYLILRMEYEYQCKFDRILIDGYCNKFIDMYNQFNKKISPIFRDRFSFNEVFNEYLTELCDFELADIICEIKYLAGFLNMCFVYQLPENLCNTEDITYDQFTRLQVYTEGSLQAALAKL